MDTMHPNLLVASSLLVAVLLCAPLYAQSPAVCLYVSPAGNDAWSGAFPAPRGTDGPLATLQGARDAIRKLKKAGGLPAGGVVVEIAAGTYEMSAPLELTAEDSGTESAPITYRGAGTGTRLVGGRRVTNWVPVTDAAVLSRLEPSARGKVYQADLRALGITDFGDVVASGKRLEVFLDGEPMTLARWPNEGFVRIKDVVSVDPVDVRGTKGDRGGKFIYDGDRPTRWLGEKDLWLHGYWFWDWSDQRMKVASIDPENHVISLAPPQHSYGYRKGQWYYAFNALCEVDAPGEWYLDRDTGLLYFYPPKPLSESTVVVSILPTMITLNDVSYTNFIGLTLEFGRANGISVSGGTHVRVLACTLRALGSGGISISGGTEHGVVGCDIYDVGDGGVSLYGGDTKTLTPAGHYVSNCHIHHYGRWNRMYKAGVNMGGVGHRISHNLIDNAPHCAILFGGNDHVIEFNEIHSVCYESNDAGAIYAGRNWVMRGNVIRYNYLHDISGFEGRGCVGVYLDDMFCGTLIYGNLFYRVTRAAFIGGGQDNTIENNIFVDCRPAVHVDARAMGWAKYHTEGWVKEAREKGTHQGIPYTKPPYSERYLRLPSILDHNPFAPAGTLIARNVCWGGKWDEIEPKARPYCTFVDNLLDEDPLFVDAAKLNFQLREDSPAYKLGFQRLPIDQMGLQGDNWRASWPVSHTVRPAQTPPAPAPRAARTNPVVFKAIRLAAPLAVDGIITAPEWGGADPAKAMVIEQGINGEKVAPRSLAWVYHDGEALRVAVDNTVKASPPLRLGNTWGQDDAVEIALRNPAAGKNAPILILRGYPSGHFVSSDEAGTVREAVERAAVGVSYAAQVLSPTRWCCEWRIPFSSLGIDPAKDRQVQFNLSVRKTAGPDWVEWQGTGSYTWEVTQAGLLEFVP
jgi:hypothetical protein